MQQMWQTSAVVREIDGNAVLGLKFSAHGIVSSVALRLTGRVVYSAVIYRVNKHR